ncbi:efflux RND transporter permease subunit, partial [uncultured Bradyrhizobium sp.]|uniref:APC family permease n=1 Tax=uncultured Bradyrhizobium sp. TaxID=199684 RepID=UPI0026071DF2
MPAGSITTAAFGLALVSTLWAFDGWADLAYNAGEVKDPQRNLPRALIGGTILVLIIYLAANVAYLAVLPIEEIRQSKLVAADVAEKVIGSSGALLVSVTVMLSTFGTLNAVLLTSPRVFFAMAEDKLFFPIFAKVHPTRGTPWIAIALVAALGAAFVLLGTFGILNAFGYSINTLTMFAMVLAIGLLVDDAIVVVENVERIMREEGLSAKDATRKSMGEITGALIGIATVLSAVFVPMAFFGGSVGVIYRQFSVTIVSAMALSVLVAIV